MEECSCASPQFVCHAARGCVCKSGFDGIDCLTPKSLTGHSSKSKAQSKIHICTLPLDNQTMGSFHCLFIEMCCKLLFLDLSSNDGVVWGVVVAFILIGVIIFVVLYFRRSVRNLKTEITHVKYIADPSSQPDRHHFDNPVYAFPAAASTSTNTTFSDNSTLLNDFRSPHKDAKLDRGNLMNIKFIQNHCSNLIINFFLFPPFHFSWRILN